MKRQLTSLLLLACTTSLMAVEDNTVEIVFSEGSATVTPASNISNYVTSSTDGAYVSIIQSEDVSDTTGEITYILSGSASDGQFYMEGSYKCTVTLSGLSLTCSKGPAMNIQNGKRVKVRLTESTTNTLTDVAGGDWKGCLVCKGHTEFKGKGSLTVNGLTAHGIWSKEYVEIKNSTINIPSPVKDGINCNQYFLMESGTLTITSPGDDGIQVSYKDDTDREEEDTGCFTQADGKISISSPTGYCIKTDATITYSGGTQDFDTSNVLQNAATAISSIAIETADTENIYDLSGRQVEKAQQKKGVYIVKNKQKTQKILVK